MPVHRAGYPFIAAFAFAALVLFVIWAPLGWIGAGLTLWCYWFFRDPERVTPARPGVIVSPADGVITAIGDALPPAEMALGRAPRRRISIFMNVFNCHVNRAPAAGTVTRIAYRPGRFVNAARDKASEDNERNALVLALDDGRLLGVVQIAGLVARRILCEVEEGTVLAAGERFGMIRFGSRLDVYLPDGVVPLVAEGQTMIAGETVLAETGDGAR